jgi:hypothetical protein
LAELLLRDDELATDATLATELALEDALLAIEELDELIELLLDEELITTGAELAAGGGAELLLPPPPQALKPAIILRDINCFIRGKRIQASSFIYY